MHTLEMLRSFWTLPVALRVVFAAQHPFSVKNDLLAFPQYEVVFSDSFVPEHVAQKRFAAQSARQDDFAQADVTDNEPYMPSADKEGEQDNLERLILDGLPYMCRIPYIPPETPENKTSDPLEKEHRQQELVRASHHGKKLLGGLEGNCLYYQAGWWMYSFCYNGNIRQFHALPPGRGVPGYPPVEDPNVPAFVLGEFKSTPKGQLDSGKSSETELSTQLQTSGETNYLVQKLGDGTTCDLTGRERRIEVQFHCNPGAPDRIAMIKETASCVYMMIIQTPRLCTDVAFLPPQLDKPNPISCQEIVSPQEEQAWKASKAAAALEGIFGARQEDGESDEGNPEEPGAPQRPVIGGIEVGAQKLVGSSPDRVIKASNIAKPQNQRASQDEKFIATLAKSDGKYTTIMSDREIQRHGLKGTHEEWTKLISDIEKWAGEGEPWSLDVVQTSKGLEFEAKMTKEEPAGKERQDKEPKDGGERRDDEREKGSRDDSKEAEETGSTEEYR